MYGYRLTLPEGVGKTLWACRSNVSDYVWQNRNNASTIEISVTTSEARTHRVGDTPARMLTGTTLACIVGDSKISTEAQTGVAVQITSVAVRFPALSATEKEFDADDLADTSVLLLPLLQEGLSRSELSEIERLLHQYIENSVKKSAVAELACHAIFLQLLCRLDAMARRTPKKGKYAHFYVGKAEAILRERYTQKLTLSAVAAELEITRGYLCAIFKEYTGCGFSERLTQLRMEKARELVQAGEYSAAEIAERTGLGDERNLRRRFKQYFGAGLGEYRHIAKEQTLYHARPVRKK
jgi:AraC-like DNA-binding protein